MLAQTNESAKTITQQYLYKINLNRRGYIPFKKQIFSS